MSYELFSDLSSLSRITNAESRSICPENFTGEKGKGGMATEGTGALCARELGQGWKVSPSIIVKCGTVAELANISGPGAIKHFWLTDDSKPTCRHLTARQLILRIYWEDNDAPSVEVPLGDFFASTAYNNGFAQVTSIPVCVNPARGLNCYWTMPFRKKCRVTLENISQTDITVYYQIDYVLTDIPENCAYFHAQFRRSNPLKYMDVHTILDNVHGQGQYVGTYLFWGVNNDGWWGEGEIKFYMDGDKDFPTICGTGTEDYICGAYNFDVEGRYTEFCTPYAGLSRVIRPDGLYRSQQRFGMYRWHITDPIYFKKDLRVTIQALGWRSGGRYLPLQDDISSVAYWYQSTPYTDFPKFPSADELEVI